jgi:hypothetical protein
MIDRLPELTTDADVDALMRRLRGKIASPQTSPVSSARPGTQPPSLPASDDPLRDFLAAQGELNASVVRALQAVWETLDELAQHASTDTARVMGPQPRKKYAHVTPSETPAKRGRATRTRTSKASRRTQR